MRWKGSALCRDLGVMYLLVPNVCAHMLLEWVPSLDTSTLYANEVWLSFSNETDVDGFMESLNKFTAVSLGS